MARSSNLLNHGSIQYLSVKILSIVNLYNSCAKLFNAQNAQIGIKHIVKSAMLIKVSTSYFWLEDNI
jgi:hypothetical protein